MTEPAQILKYVTKLASTNPEKAAEIIEKFVGSAIKKGQQRIEYEIFDDKRGLPHMIEEYGSVFLKTLIRVLEFAIEDYGFKRTRVDGDEKNKRSLLVTGRESTIEDMEVLVGLLDMAIVITKRESEKFLEQSPDEIVELLPDYFSNYAFPVTIGFGLIEDHPELLHQYTVDYFLEDRYLSEIYLHYSYTKALRAVYPFWEEDVKQTWFNKIIGFDFIFSKPEYNDEFRLEMLCGVSEKDRSEEITKAIEILKKTTGKECRDEPVPMLRYLGSREVGPPSTYEDMKTWGLPEVEKYVIGFLKREIQTPPFSDSAIAFGGELAKLPVADFDKYKELSETISRITTGDYVDDDRSWLVNTYISGLNSGELGVTEIYVLVEPFFVSDDSGVRLSVCRIIDDIINRDFESERRILTDDILKRIKTYLIECKSDPRPAGTVVEKGLGFLGTALNSTRGYAYIALTMLYCINPEDDDVKKAVISQVEDPNQSLRISFLGHLDNLYTVAEEFCFYMVRNIIKHEDPVTRASFLPYAPRLYPLLTEEIVDYLTKEIGDVDGEVKKRAFEILVSGYFVNPRMKQIVDLNIFRRNPAPELQSIAAAEFVDLLGKDQHTEEALAALVELLKQGAPEVIKETFRLFAYVNKGDIESSGKAGLRFSIFKELLAYLIGSLTGDESTVSGYHSYNFFGYIEAASDYYADECFQIIYPAMEKTLRISDDDVLSYYLRDITYKLVKKGLKGKANYDKGMDFLEFLAGKGDTRAFEYWMELKPKRPGNLNSVKTN